MESVLADKPEPKRRNLEQTRARILAAAADVFTRSGYANSGLREIAVQAEVAPSLVSRYFGSKAALFEEALVHVLRANSVFTWQKVGFGEAMARLIPERSNTNITVMLVTALADPEAKEIARRVSREHMIQPLVDWLGPPHALERAMDLFALMTGFVIQMDGLYPETIPDHSLRWLARSLQAIVDGED
ncbi:TetR/AcrR family transcriptional regulator [Novosphingobium sp. JCM 18896]|uniref:TetR/AcrR family transcriptional regulator n=1 Tax=Novosphingobium sp. JCM 18896 TaxID=2989731 RepID=UPI0022223C34|nr:TetR/AcrR family transcriptional regulator [Novosphingobium sp. JCM 18896]MCW1431272.1 TetR family transcriptional regulator [Novosphingobium sp. JCM 18896]